MYSQKDRLHVLIISRGLEIRGDLHVLAGSRLTDALNSKGKDFLPITDATISVTGSEEPLRTQAYVAVNRDSIDCIMEIEGE